MGHKLMGDTLPAKTACQDAQIDMVRDESVLILIKHCQDMKQQEARLRLITLLLLLGCTALFIFAIFAVSANLRQHNNPESSGQVSAVEERPAYLKQEKVCPADNPQTNLERMRILLRSNLKASNNKTEKEYIEWDVMFGEKYNNKENRAIVIPETGSYFVYVRIALSCPGKDAAAQFYVELHTRSEGYNKTVSQMEAWDVITCPLKGYRSVFVGELLDLLKGDLVSVWIGEGYNLIMKSFFGAYLT